MEINWTATAAVIQAVATIFTAAYVYLTYRLVRSAERPLVAIRLAAQETAAKSLLDSMSRKVAHLLFAASKFPIDLSGVPDANDFEFKDVLSLATELGAIAAQLPPGAFRACNEASLLVNAASENIFGLYISIAAAQGRARGGEVVSWDGVRAMYLVYARQLIPSRLEWDDVISGKFVFLARNAIEGLHDALYKYLMHPS